MAGVGVLSNHGLPLPASELRQERRSTAPVRVFARRGEPRRDLLPPALGHDCVPRARLGTGLTGHGPRQGEAPGVARRCCPGRAGRGRTRLEVLRVRQQGRPRRGQERGLQARLQGTRRRGGDGVEAGPRRVQPEAAVALPAHPVAGGDLPRAEPWGPGRAAKAVARRGRDADAPAMQWWRRPPQRDVGIKGPAVTDEGLRLEAGLAVGAGQALRAERPAGAVVPRGLPVRGPVADAPDSVGVTGPPTGQTGSGPGGQPALAPPGVGALQRPAVLLPGGADMVPYRGTAAEARPCWPVLAAS